MSDILVRHWVAGDLDALVAIEAVSYTHPWTRKNFEDARAVSYLGLVLQEEEALQAPAITAYCIAMPVMDELHLLNMTVTRDKRRGGRAQVLWRHLELEATKARQSSIWLEVRQSNATARALYQKMGAVQVGLRKNYYLLSRTEREDALLMRKALD